MPGHAEGAVKVTPVKPPWFLPHSAWQRCPGLPENPPLLFKGKLYGRGATDNKGPVLAWINAVGAFRALQEVSGRRRPGGRVAPMLRAARPKPSAGCGLFLPPAVSGGVGDHHARLADEESEAWEGWGTCSQPPGWPGVVDVSP